MKLPPFKSPIAFGFKRSVPAAVSAVIDLHGVHSGEVTRSMLEARLPDWKCKPVTGADGIVRMLKLMPQATVPNIKAIAYLYGWRIRYNEMTKRVELTRQGVVIPGDDQDNIALTLLGDDIIRCGIARDGLAALVDAAAMDDHYHPALAWIESRPWDGVSRLADFHATLELTDPRKATLAAKLLNQWMLQGIGALLEPNGVAAQGMMVLAGPQHIGKTHWVMHLASVGGVVGTGLHLDPENKDSVLRAIRYWIAELGELGATVRRADVEALKAFLTNMEDVLRLPYAKRDTSYRRRTIFVGTVNGTGFLVDDTGNRRFWVLEVKRCHALTAEAMQQVWAEYLHLYRNGARWHLDPQTLAELNTSNEQFTAVDPLREKIATRWDWTDTGFANGVNLCWLAASDICQRVGIERPTKSEATRAGAVVRHLQAVCAQGHLNTMERKSNGVRLLAVPTKLGGVQ